MNAGPAQPKRAEHAGRWAYQLLPSNLMDTLQKFLDWCRANPNKCCSEYPIDFWEQLDNWRQAIADVTSIECTFMPPWQILKTIESAKKFFGPEILDDIQRTYNDL